MYVTTNEMQPFEPEHIAAMRALAPECMVLLKKNGDFPLPSACKVALYGSGARQTIKGGTGSGGVNVRHYTTVEEGLEKAGFTVTTKAWMDAYDAEKEAGRAAFFQSIREEAAAKGKPAFLVGMGKVQPEPTYAFPIEGEGEVGLYILARNSGEGSDRSAGKGDFRLTDDEVRDILACAEKYPKFMLVLNVGGPVDLTPVLGKVGNILLLGQLGTVTGDAFADVLLGKTYPSGKLSTTWANAEDYPTTEGFAEIDDTRYTEGVFVGYRYFDTVGKTPVFPFGFGLGYTDFETGMTGFSVENSVALVTAEVKNIGKFAGKETVQLYYGAPDGRLKKPVRELGTYGKTKELQPGETQELALKLPIENMASWDEQNAAWLLEHGVYILYLGQRPVASVTLDGDTVTAHGVCGEGKADFQDWQPEREKTIPAGIPNIDVPAKSLRDAGHFERGRIRPETPAMPDMSGFTDEELATACVGKHLKAQGYAAIIGNSSSIVAGGAGESAEVIFEKGYGRLVTADGPAGLRISMKYAELPTGAVSLDTDAFGDMTQLLSEPFRQLLENRFAELEECGRQYGVRYHYASAIPIGTALAQAWDPAVAEKCADIVGDEMERFGVNVWLAPAMNIHRSPLCGRNFEYYSEDPVLSGHTAAAITRGVQKHERCAVTIKHFCCNNQETNRMGSNSVVSQRALREIYLKGFEICVKEAAPIAVMTSYNLLNGTHTANHRDLLTDVLRGEWGFGGFVMTDWGTTGEDYNLGKYGGSSAALCIKAGNDLIMPGEVKDVEGILQGLADGTITRAELETCAGRMLTISRKLS